MKQERPEITHVINQVLRCQSFELQSGIRCVIVYRCVQIKKDFLGFLMVPNSTSHCTENCEICSCKHLHVR
jgi:hypothetical protein